MLWDETYTDEATQRLRALQEREMELYKSSLSIPYDERKMTEMQNYVQEQHGLGIAA